MIHNLNKWLIITIIVIIASGTALTLWTIQREDNLLRTDLIIKTRHLSNDIGIEHVIALTVTGAHSGCWANLYRKKSLLIYADAMIGSLSPRFILCEIIPGVELSFSLLSRNTFPVEQSVWQAYRQ